MAKGRGPAFQTPPRINRVKFELGRPIRDWLSMEFRGPPCKTLADMTEPEIRALEREYGAPVIRPA
jgi:hypothetical protein